MLNGRPWPGILSISIGLIALGSLIYTLANLEALGITLAHPRVIVEASLSLIFLVAGIYLFRKKNSKS